MKILLIIFLLVLTLNANSTQDCSSATPEIKSIFIRNDIDLEAKSNKGWIRIFNSKEKILHYGYKVNEYERFLILDYLRNKGKLKSDRYSRGVK